MLRTAALLTALLAAAPAGAQPASWVHLEVTGHRHRPARVRMTLPVSAVVRALPHVPRVRLDRCHLAIGHQRVRAEDLSLVVAALHRVEPGTTVRRDTAGGWIEAIVVDDRVRIAFEETFDGDRVEASLPQDVAVALTSGGPQRLEVAAAVRALAARGGGELALVTSEDARVRLWIDRDATPKEE